MADNGKRTEQIKLLVTERMALDLMHLASQDDRSISDYLFRLLNREMYGSVARDDRKITGTNKDGSGL
jgi:hypothetical protein